MSIERSILIRIWMTHCVCFSSYTSPTSFFCCFQHPIPTWTVHDHKTMTEHFIFFFYLQLSSLPQTLRLTSLPSGLPLRSQFLLQCPLPLRLSLLPNRHFHGSTATKPLTAHYWTASDWFLSIKVFILLFSPPKRFVWLSETLVNPFRDCQHSAYLCFDLSLPRSFTALITHFWLLIACALSPL